MSIQDKILKRKLKKKEKQKLKIIQERRTVEESVLGEWKVIF